MFQQQQPPSGLTNPAQFRKPQYGVGYGTKNECGKDRIETVVGKQKALDIHFLKIDI